jgi:RNA polymerase sigma factor, sigma-70 family
MYIRRESYRYVSLDELIGDDDLTLNDLIIDPSINIEGDYMDKEEIKDINGVINLLNSKDKCLFNLYFRDGYSQIEISNILGVSQSYISRRIKMLVDKLEELLYQKNIIVKSKVKSKSIGYNKKIVM